MKLPLRMRLFGVVYSRFGDPISKTTPDDVPKVRARQARNYGWRAARAILGPHAPGVAVQSELADGADGARIPVRIYRPSWSDGRASEDLPVVVNFHGGGWTTGGLDQSEWLCREVCLAAGIAVVSVDYRLAPEWPFPVPPEDCYAATRWVAREAERLGFDAGRLAVMGDSAGGNLAAVVALMSRDRGGPSIRSQILIYPGTDLTRTYPSELTNAKAPVLHPADIAAHSAYYRADTDGSDPYASPLLASDHSRLPPALVQTAEHDPLLDEGRRYAEVLAAAGVAVRYTQYVGAAHGYISMPGLARIAEQALWEIGFELRARLWADA